MVQKMTVKDGIKCIKSPEETSQARKKNSVIAQCHIPEERNLCIPPMNTTHGPVVRKGLKNVSRTVLTIHFNQGLSFIPFMK